MLAEAVGCRLLHVYKTWNINVLVKTGPTGMSIFIKGNVAMIVTIPNLRTS